MFSMQKARKTLIGDRVFYKAVLAIIIPVIIQNGISNFVNLLDNLMVGALGDAQMSGVSIANQLVFVFNLAVFGGLAGPGIFGAQFYGAGDIKGLRATFRIKILECIFLLAVAFVALLGFAKPLISLFLQGDGDAALAEEMLQCPDLRRHPARDRRDPGAHDRQRGGGVHQRGVQLPFDLRQAGPAPAGGGGRGPGHGDQPLCGAPHRELRKVLRMGAPLLMNELLWSIGMSTLTAVYSLCGLVVVSALSITFTISNLFNSIYMSLGTAVSVMVGQALGAGDFEKAKADVWRLMFFGVMGAIAMGLLLFLSAPHRHHPAAGHRLRHAPVFLRPLLLFHPALRRQNGDHLPV